MSLYWLLVGVLVVWRITHLIQAEDGPWNVVARLRGLAGTSILGELMDCFYCLSLWVAAPVAYGLGATWWERLWHWPAMSAAAILLERLSARHETANLPPQLGNRQDVVLWQEQSADIGQHGESTADASKTSCDKAAT
jgi:hypothetical protein